MALNIMDLFTGTVGKNLTSNISKALNEPESNVADALQNAVSGLLGGMVGNSNDDSKVQELLNKVSDQSSGLSGLLDNVDDAFAGDSESIKQKGEGLLNTIFGGDTNMLNNVINTISGSGVSPNNARNILGMAAPFLGGLLGKQVNAGGLNASGLQNLLQGQLGYLKNVSPDMIKNLKLEDFSPKIQQDVHNIEKSAQKLGDNVQKLGDDVKGEVKGAIDTATDRTQRAGEAISDSVNKAGDQLGQGAAKAEDAIKSNVDKAGQHLERGAKQAGDALQNTADKVGNIVDKAGNRISNTLDEAGKATEKTRDAVAGAADKVGDTIQKGTDKAGKAMGSAIDKAGSTLQKGADKAGQAVGSATDKAGKTLERGAENAQNAMEGKGFKFGPILGIIAAVLLGFFLFRQCNMGDAVDKVTDTAGEVAGAAGEAAGDVVDATGDAINAAADALTSLSLPNGESIDIQPGSYLEKFVNVLGGKEDWDMSKPFVAEGYNFETGSANLTSESMENVKKLAAALDAFPDATIRLEGHTDNTGNSDSNMLLSQNRANAIKAQLEELGVDAKRVEAVGKGDTMPIASNDTDEGKEKNRRVEVYITKK